MDFVKIIHKFIFLYENFSFFIFSYLQFLKNNFHLFILLDNISKFLNYIMEKYIHIHSLINHNHDNVHL